MARCKKSKKKRRGKAKHTISVLELVSIEAAARRQVWIEQGCPQFKSGRSVDRKKMADKKSCRGRVSFLST